jgi:hypothetical protein
MLADERAVTRRIGERDHQANGHIPRGSNHVALDLGRAQLSLQVDDRALDLDMDDLLGADEHQVGRPRISGATGISTRGWSAGEA